MRIRSSAAAFVRFCAIAVATAALPCAASAQTSDAPACRGVDYNRMILDIVRGLPIVAPLEINNRWELLVRHGHPSHCTSATYSVFLHLATVLQSNRKLYLDGDQIRALEATETMPDGTHLVDGQGPRA